MRRTNTKFPDFYVISLAIIGSVLLFGPGQGKLAYIDALAFAAGGATQAGLNTVNVNLLTTYQQAVIFCIAGIANPITIHSFVVVLRLYWFEKRFRHIVSEARLRRGTLSKSKSKFVSDQSRLEDGVNGRNITIIHGGARSRLANDGSYLGPMGAAATDGPAHDGTNGIARRSTMGAEGANGSAAGNGDMPPPKFTLSEPLEARRPEIKFAPTVKRSDGLDDDLTKLPPHLSDEEHIAILERQRRNQTDDEVLRIPGPRDADRGILPSRIVRRESDEDGEPVSPVLRHRTRRLSDASANSLRLNQLPKSAANVDGDGEGSGKSGEGGDDGEGGGAQNDGGRDSAEERRDRQGLAQAITIQEPEKPLRVDALNENAHAFADVISSLRPRRPHAHGHGSGDDSSVGGNLHQTTSSRSKRRQKIDHLKRVFSRDKEQDPAPYLSWEPTLGRNSAFLGLSEEQREELGGIEYRSLKTLAMVLLGYYWGFWLLGVVSLVPWILNSSTYGSVVDEASQSRVWWGFFTPHSAFMDLGFTLTPDSMISFNTAIFPLLLMSFLIVIGNTGFPVMLRFVIWVSSNVVPRGSGVYEELKFLLDHPRRCFTLLFPSGATWWLFWLLVILNGIDLLFFIVLDVSLPCRFTCLFGSTRNCRGVLIKSPIPYSSETAPFLLSPQASVF